MPIPSTIAETIKLGNTLTKEQKQAAIELLSLSQNQDPELLKFLYSSVETILDSRNEDSDDISTTSTLLQNNPLVANLLQQIKHLDTSSVMSDDLRSNLTTLFNGAKSLTKHAYDEQSSDPSMSSVKEPYQMILPTIRTFVGQLSKTTEDYEQKVKAEKRRSDLLSEENKKQEMSSPSKSDQQRLVDLLQKALNDNNAYYQITSSQLSIIKNSLGEENFNFLITRYNILEKNFTLDDLRMLIIGILPHSNQEWMNNNFVKSLFICCNIEKEFDATHPEKMQKLRENININSSVWERIEKTPHDGIINQGLDFLRTRFLEKWKFIIPTRFKSNSAFKRDLDIALSLSKIRDWQKKPKELQEFSATEFLFHKLSCSDLQNDAIIPILEANGTRNFYKVKNLIDKPSIHGFALVPIDPKKSLDIKVVFKSSTSLAKEIIDTENFIPHQEFKQHKPEILQELNKVVADFKKHLPPNKHNAISLNIGGHGTGAVLGQHLTNELITDQASVACHKNPSLLERHLESNIEKQLEYEIDCGNKIKNLESHKDDIKQYSIKHLSQAKKSMDEIISPTNNHLREINNFNLSTVNSGGIPMKIRNNFIQSLSILKQSSSSTSIKCTKIMASGDPIQQTGATDLAAYIPPRLMTTNLIKIQAVQEGSYKTNLKQIAKSAGLLVIQTVLAAKAAAVPLLAPFIFLINPKKESENIIDNANLLIDNAKHAHRDCHLNKQSNGSDQLSYQIMSNANNSKSLQQLNKELTTKITVFDSKPYKDLKKSVYQACKMAHEKLHQAEKHVSPIIGGIDKVEYSKHIPQAQQALRDIRTFIDDPRGKTELLTPLLRTPTKAKAEQQRQNPSTKQPPHRPTIIDPD